MNTRTRASGNRIVNTIIVVSGLALAALALPAFLFGLGSTGLIDLGAIDSHPIYRLK